MTVRLFLWDLGALTRAVGVVLDHIALPILPQNVDIYES
jgi:hypothetical protein